MGKGSTFSKASFASAADRTDINIDDPDFWKKWAKRAEIDTEQLMNNGTVELVLSEPRRRTQIKRYGQDEGVMDVSDLESTSNSDEENGGVPSTRSKVAGRSKDRSRRSLRRSRRGNYDEDFAPDDGEVDYGSWSKNECFKIEKGLLTFGWGRWREIMAHGQFRKGWRESDIEDCARMMVVYCLQNFRGDEKIKSFVWDLIVPAENGQAPVERNHSGLATPIARGRKGKKVKGKDSKGSMSAMFEGADWTRDEKYDPEQLLDSGYRRHVTRHANKVLLRIRMLYYIKQEIIRECEIQVNAGVTSAMLPIQTPFCDQPPTPWWDSQADISLLVGSYKHGYERYAVMRLDPSLSFLARCGPPDKQELLSEMASLEATGEELDKAADEEEDIDDDSSSTTQGPTPSAGQVVQAVPIVSAPGDKLPFPPVSELNTRLRRLITAYQRNFKKEEMKMAQKAKRMERREKIETIVREREKQKIEMQQRRWTRREEADFFRTISNFGVEYNKKMGRYDWTRFRAISRLERKYDETLTEYLRAFCAMCKKACGRKLTEEEEVAQAMVEPISEERARRCLERLELLCKIREEVLSHSQLEERIKLCQPSVDMPDWWVCGKHDRDLLMGAAKHGLGRTDFYYVHDPDLAYREILRRHYSSEPLIYPQEKKERDKIEDAMKAVDAKLEVSSDSEAEVDPATKKKETSKERLSIKDKVLNSNEEEEEEDEEEEEMQVDVKDPEDLKDPKDLHDSKIAKNTKDAKDAKDAKDIKDSKNPQVSKDSKDSKDSDELEVDKESTEEDNAKENEKEAKNFTADDDKSETETEVVVDAEKATSSTQIAESAEKTPKKNKDVTEDETSTSKTKETSSIQVASEESQNQKQVVDTETVKDQDESTPDKSEEKKDKEDEDDEEKSAEEGDAEETEDVGADASTAAPKEKVAAVEEQVKAAEEDSKSTKENEEKEDCQSMEVDDTDKQTPNDVKSVEGDEKSTKEVKNSIEDDDEDQNSTVEDKKEKNSIEDDPSEKQVTEQVEKIKEVEVAEKTNEVDEAEKTKEVEEVEKTKEVDKAEKTKEVDEIKEEVEESDKMDVDEDVVKKDVVKKDVVKKDVVKKDAVKKEVKKETME